jgi:hypothetical protein
MALPLLKVREALDDHVMPSVEYIAFTVPDNATATKRPAPYVTLTQ